MLSLSHTLFSYLLQNTKVTQRMGFFMPQSERFLEILKIPREDYYIFGCKGSPRLCTFLGELRFLRDMNLAIVMAVNNNRFSFCTPAPPCRVPATW